MLEPRRTRTQSMIQLEPDEMLAVLRAAKARGTREWAMIVVAYKHGLRASEVCSVRLDDIDLKNGSIVVDRLKGSLRTIPKLSMEWKTCGSFVKLARFSAILCLNSGSDV